MDRQNILYRVGLVLAFVLGGCGLIGPAIPAMAAPVAPAIVHPMDGAGHSLIITHKSNDGDTLLVCKDWSGSSNVRSDCPSKFANLAKGKNTKDELGWADTDGIRVGKNQTAMWSKSGPDRAIYTSCGKARWVKMTPDAFGGSDGGKKTVYLVHAAVC